MAARRAHNPKVAGSNPAPATKKNKKPVSQEAGFFISKDTNLSGLLSKISKLSPADIQLLGSLIQSKPASILATASDGVRDWQNELNIRGLSPRTIRLYTTAVRQVFEKYPNPTSQTIRSYLADRLVAVSPTRVRNDQKGIKSFFNFLEEQGLWLDNPVKGMKLLRIAKVIRQAPDKEDVDKLLKAWHSSKRRLKERLFIALFADTGIRLTEACSIQRQNVFIDRQEIKVLGKGMKERIVPISPAVVDLLKQYMDTLYSDSIYLFPARNKNGYQCQRIIDRVFVRICKRLHIKPITPHCLRHYFATYALRNGAKLEVISRILGHASVGITGDVYRTVKQDEIREEHTRFSPLSTGN